MKFQLINFRIKKPQTHPNQELLTWAGKYVTQPYLWVGKHEHTFGQTGKNTFFFPQKEKFSHPESRSLLAWNLPEFTPRKTLIKFERPCTEKENGK